VGNGFFVVSSFVVPFGPSHVRIGALRSVHFPSFRSTPFNDKALAIFFTEHGSPGRVSPFSLRALGDFVQGNILKKRKTKKRKKKN
jgi:hypothetical protein